MGSLLAIMAGGRKMQLKTLNESHRKQLHASGLTDETIDANGLWSCLGVGTLVAELLNQPKDLAKSIGAGLVIPYYDIDEQNGFNRYRPDKLWFGAKYISPKGKGNRAYFPKQLREKLKSGNYSNLMITEGEKKALCATQYDLDCIGIAGIWNWKIPKQDELIPDLDSIIWMDRTVTICFDSDIKVNTDIKKAEAELARILSYKGARVRLLRIPHSEEKKAGIDDYIVEHGIDEFKKLLSKAKYFKPSSKPNINEYSTSITSDSGKTDNANADRFLDRYSEVLRFVPEWKCWLSWDGRRWSRNTGQHTALKLARCYAKSMYGEISKLAEEKIEDKHLNACVHFIRKSNSTPSINNFLRLAEADDRVLIPADNLDAKPLLLNCLNGTVDFVENRFRPHQPDDLLTQVTNVSFDEEAKCPRWEAALALIFEDPEVISYVQQLLGYSCTGLTGEPILPICVGDGRNGKSFIWMTVSGILGCYAYTANEELLRKSNNDRHPAEREALRGMRFVTVSELSENTPLDEARVKQLTGDTVNSRGMFSKFGNFESTHKFWLSTNHEPRITGRDEGIWRRIKKIPFNIDISTKTTPIKDYHKILIQEEGSGILNWMIAGYLHYRNNQGFSEPSSVQLATASYRTQEDDLQTFIAECCDCGEGLVATSTELYEAYQSHGGKMSRCKFGLQMKQQFSSDTPTSGTYRRRVIYFGISLRT
jgi:P4 family phage/plasmid primase-like protien